MAKKNFEESEKDENFADKPQEKKKKVQPKDKDLEQTSGGGPGYIKPPGGSGW